jgi:dihydroorotase
MKTVIKDAIVINEGFRFTGTVVIEGERITGIFRNGLPAGIDIMNADVIDASGQYLLPGVIDDQVHFREPGLTHKGDISSESMAAVAGGITSYMDMPNTSPQTVTQKLLEDKYITASEKSVANYSFYMGVTNDNLKEVLKTDPSKVCGIKVFLGSSTGNMLVSRQDVISDLFANAPTLIAAHCEDESVVRSNTEKVIAMFGDQIPFAFHPLIRDEDACYRSSERAVELASRYGTRLHVLHLSTAREMELFSPGEVTGKKITAEVCIHHLWFDNSWYEKLGSLMKWNPSIKAASDRQALWSALLSDRIDVIATDHAPHTLEEKGQPYVKAPSGGPLVQHSLVSMLEMSRLGKITPEQIVRKMCHAPADLFRIRNRGYIREGYYADLVLVDPRKPSTVSSENLLYKCGWSPFTGTTFSHTITHTFVNGQLVYKNNQVNREVRGQRLLFNPF